MTTCTPLDSPDGAFLIFSLSLVIEELREAAGLRTEDRVRKQSSREAVSAAAAV